MVSFAQQEKTPHQKEVDKPPPLEPANDPTATFPPLVALFLRVARIRKWREEAMGDFADDVPRTLDGKQ
jgi:hypothetical protein